MKQIPFIVLGMLIALISGCTSVWQNHYTGVPIGRYEPVERVTVRQVPWVRINDAIQKIDTRRANSDIHYDDWTQEEKLEEQAMLLRGLQLPQDPRDVIVLGRSAFNSTARLSPLDGALLKFASALGADYAIWASRFNGKTEEVVREPVYESGYEWRSFRDSSGVYRRRYEPWNRTVYVPMVIEKDEYAWMVYYIRLKDRFLETE